ncbi:phage terminase small subunit [Brevundimonas diminuta]|uniref:phage terminase small subunit n=1 Tax=Brevundimonas diminuta TaxID=293 RepID=UPI0022AF2D41|nr:phage terminase small subunit [Brevundimonas diminuta]MCZ4107599.1 phage terminase small subunit [Brevundimonas diminuta]
MTPAEIAKARAEEAAKEKADAAAQAQAAALKKARPKLRPQTRAMADVPTPRPGRASPAAQRRAFLIASSAGRVLAASGVAVSETAVNDDIELSPDVAKVVLQLEADIRRLKEIKATDRKVEAKIQMMPAYRAWCDGVLAAGKVDPSPLDQVFTTIMAWTIDIGDYMTALPMLEHAMLHKLDMPAGFSRDPITFAIDQICEDAIRVYDAGGEAASTFEAGVLPMLQDLVRDHDVDLHDEVEAKLHKAIGRAIMAGADPENEPDLLQRRKSALLEYQAALAKDERVGVKGDIAKLHRELKKAEPDAGKASTDTPPQQGG